MSLDELKERIKEEVVLYEGDLYEWQWRQLGLVAEAEVIGISASEFMTLVNEVSRAVNPYFGRISDLKNKVADLARTNRKKLTTAQTDQIVADAVQIQLLPKFIIERWIPSILNALPESAEPGDNLITDQLSSRSMTEAVSPQQTLQSEPVPSTNRSVTTEKASVVYKVEQFLSECKTDGGISSSELRALFVANNFDENTLAEAIMAYFTAKSFTPKKDLQGETLKSKLLSTDWQHSSLKNIDAIKSVIPDISLSRSSSIPNIGLPETFTRLIIFSWILITVGLCLVISLWWIANRKVSKEFGLKLANADSKSVTSANTAKSGPILTPISSNTQKTLSTAIKDSISTSIDTSETEEAVLPVSYVTRADNNWSFLHGGLVLILSLVNMAGLIYLWRQRPNRNSVTPVMRNPLIEELSNRVSMLERKYRELANQLNKPASAVTKPAEPRRADSVAASPNPVVVKQNPVTPSPEPTRQEQAAPTVSAQPIPAPRPTQPAPTSQPAFQNQGAPSNQPHRREVVLYGRTADLGDGFSVASLLTAPDRDTVFQLEVRTDSQAVYRVTEEPGAQQLALSDSYSYLADACEYLAKPIPNGRIRTDKPGQLTLQGDKWRIAEKAKISFY